MRRFRSIESRVARATGESLRTVRARGFSAPLEPGPGDPVALAVPCPRCGSACPLEADASGLPAMAECPRPSCDIYFDYRPGDVFGLDAAGLRAAVT